MNQSEFDRLFASLLASQERVRLFYGDPVTGKVEPEEHAVLGRVGRSTGTTTVYLLVHNRRAKGGHLIDRSRLLGVMSTADGRWLAKRPEGIDIGTYAVVKCNLNGYPFAVLHNSETWAKCKTHAHADRLCQFMLGRRFCT